MKNLKITHYGFNAFVIQNDKVKVAIDPGQDLYWTRFNSLIPKTEWEGVTHVFVTHGDPDHFVYAIPIAKQTGAKVICGAELEGDFLSNGIKDVYKIGVDGVMELENLKVDGLKARHGPLIVKLGCGLMEMKNILLEGSHGGQEIYFASIKLSEKKRVINVRNHGTVKFLFGLIRLEKDNIDFARGSVGFKITIGDKTIVNLGDTVLQEGWENLKPDVLMIPIGGNVFKNTMDEKDALEAVKRIKPKIVIPCHYNGGFLWKRIMTSVDVENFKKEVEKIGIECRIMKYNDEISI